MTASAFDQLLAEYLAMRGDLLRFFAARLGNQAQADDLYQELFVRLRLSRLPEDVSSPRGFIYRSAYNLANEVIRAGRRRRARDADWVDSTTHRVGAAAVADQPGADEVLAAKQRLAAIMRALDALSPKAREVFTLCRIEGLNHRDVAAQLGISTKTVEKHMTTALKHLTEKLWPPGGA